MQRPIRPAWLLRQADELAGRNAGPGQPRNSNLRRAASAAYYALFHAIGRAMARHLLIDGNEEEFARVARSLDHGAVFDVCGWVAKNQPRPLQMDTIRAAASASPQVVDIADALLELREQRHLADYDHLADFSKAGVLALIDLSRDAVRKLEAAQLQDAPALRRFLTLVALKTGIR